jgi:uroporphyrin-III C-methyltransferase
VPGITSGTAVPATLGIPVTHREYTHGVTFVTGHTQDGTPVNWRALVEGGTTLVIYMGMKNLPEIVTGLLDAGMANEMPAAIIQQGTLPKQKQVITTLASLPMAAQQEKMASPALIVVGDVVSLARSEALTDALKYAA